jgi:hypothetical protein
MLSKRVLLRRNTGRNATQNKAYALEASFVAKEHRKKCSTKQSVCSRSKFCCEGTKGAYAPQNKAYAPEASFVAKEYRGLMLHKTFLEGDYYASNI